MGQLSEHNTVPPVCLTSKFATVRTGRVVSTRQDNSIPLKIGLTQIPEEGLQLDGHIAAADLHFAPGEGESVVFPTPVRLQGQLTRISEQVYFQGNVGGIMELPCSRCLDSVQDEFAVTIRVVYLPPSSPAAAESTERLDTSDELDLYIHDGIMIDLQPFIYDQVVLAIPMQPLCRPECAGLCPQCGGNKNDVACACQDEEINPRFALLKQLQFPKTS
jgi:uncharacterized protein